MIDHLSFGEKATGEERTQQLAHPGKASESSGAAILVELEEAR